MARSRSRSREHRQSGRERAGGVGGRERSRSPMASRADDRERGRRRDGAREMERYGRRRSRSRSREGRRRLSSRERRSDASGGRVVGGGRERGPAGTGLSGMPVIPKNAVPDFLMQRKPLTEADFADRDDEDIEMMKLMGFGGFETTKGKKVPGNNVSGVHVIQKRKYRQYMNRKGGFNRPLDFVA